MNKSRRNSSNSRPLRIKLKTPRKTSLYKKKKTKTRENKVKVATAVEKNNRALAKHNEVQKMEYQSVCKELHAWKLKYEQCSVELEKARAGQEKEKRMVEEHLQPLRTKLEAISFYTDKVNEHLNLSYTLIDNLTKVFDNDLNAVPSTSARKKSNNENKGHTPKLRVPPMIKGQTLLQAKIALPRVDGLQQMTTIEEDSENSTTSSASQSSTSRLRQTRERLSVVAAPSSRQTAVARRFARARQTADSVTRQNPSTRQTAGPVGIQTPGARQAVEPGGSSGKKRRSAAANGASNVGHLRTMNGLTEAAARLTTLQVSLQRLSPNMIRSYSKKSTSSQPGTSSTHQTVRLGKKGERLLKSLTKKGNFNTAVRSRKTIKKRLGKKTANRKSILKIVVNGRLNKASGGIPKKMERPKKIAKADEKRSNSDSSEMSTEVSKKIGRPKKLLKVDHILSGSNSNGKSNDEKTLKRRPIVADKRKKDNSASPKKPVTEESKPDVMKRRGRSQKRALSPEEDKSETKRSKVSGIEGEQEFKKPESEKAKSPSKAKKSASPDALENNSTETVATDGSELENSSSSTICVEGLIPNKESTRLSSGFPSMSVENDVSKETEVPSLKKDGKHSFTESTFDSNMEIAFLNGEVQTPSNESVPPAEELRSEPEARQSDTSVSALDETEQAASSSAESNEAEPSSSSDSLRKVVEDDTNDSEAESVASSTSDLDLPSGAPSRSDSNTSRKTAEQVGYPDHGSRDVNIHEPESSEGASNFENKTNNHEAADSNSAAAGNVDCNASVDAEECSSSDASEDAECSTAEDKVVCSSSDAAGNTDCSTAADKVVCSSSDAAKNTDCAAAADKVVCSSSNAEGNADCSSVVEKVECISAARKVDCNPVAAAGNLDKEQARTEAREKREVASRVPTLKEPSLRR